MSSWKIEWSRRCRQFLMNKTKTRIEYVDNRQNVSILISVTTTDTKHSEKQSIPSTRTAEKKPLPLPPTSAIYIPNRITNTHTSCIMLYTCTHMYQHTRTLVRRPNISCMCVNSKFDACERAAAWSLFSSLNVRHKLCIFLHVQLTFIDIEQQTFASFHQQNTELLSVELQ